MAKNKKTMKTDRLMPALPPEPISAAGRRLIAAGGALLVLGFYTLTFADPLGRNAAAVASPFLLIFGYAAIGLGLFLPPAASKTVSSPEKTS